MPFFKSMAVAEDPVGMDVLERSSPNPAKVKLKNIYPMAETLVLDHTYTTRFPF